MKIIPSSRKNRYIAGVIILLAAIALIVWLVSWLSAPSSEIRTWYDLDAVRNNVDGNYTLMNDLDSTTPGYKKLASPTANEGRGWQPIVGIGTWGDLVGFGGTLDGQGHEIRDLFINRPGQDNVGLFRSAGGIIKDIGLVNVTVTGDWDVGSLAGSNYGTVSNSYSTGSVTGNNRVGGLLGENYRGTVSNSHFTGRVTNDGSYVGGLVGWNEGGTVSNSYYNYDEVLINGEKVITIGALFDKDFEEWLANDKFLDVNDRLSQENGYYVVNDVTDFKELLAFGQDGSLKFRLTNDLNLATEPGLYIPYFAGEFDGNGHKISNLSFDFDFISQVGLFGHLASGGKVTQVDAENVNITACVDVGGLVGCSYGTVSNCYHTTGSVNGDQSVGGLVGRNWDMATVSNSYSTGSVSGGSWVGGLVGQNGGIIWKQEGNVSNSYSTSSVSGGNRVGGLVGSNDGHVSNCYYTTGSVSGSSSVGGLVGFNDNTVSKCYSTGIVSGGVDVGGLVGRNDVGTVSDSHATGSVSGEEYVGGLVGFNHGTTMSNSYATGNVTGTSRVGGLVGVNEDIVNNCYATGSVTGSWDVGGLVGDNRHPNTTVSDSYATGSVSGEEYVGGLVGDHFEGSVTKSYSTGSVSGESYVGGLVGRIYVGTVSNSYSTGSVTGSAIIGGLVGFNYDGTASNSFWDTETSGQATSDGGTGKTTLQMQDIATFSGVGWHIIAVALNETNPAYIWNIVDDETYPFLSWQS